MGRSLTEARGAMSASRLIECSARALPWLMPGGSEVKPRQRMLVFAVLMRLV